MSINLVVTIPFGPYAKGDVIADADKVVTALETNAANVVKVAKPAEPEGASDPAPVQEPEAAPQPAKGGSKN